MICMSCISLFLLGGCGLRPSVTQADAQSAVSAESASSSLTPDTDTLQAFFAAYGASSVMDAGENLKIFTGEDAEAIFAGYLNYGEPGTLSAAGFQTYGKVPDADTLAYLREALSLFFSETDRETLDSFLEKSFQKADRKTEYSAELRAADRKILLYIRPENSASPSCEMVISL